MGAQTVNAGLPLMEQGLDSLAAVELRNGAAAAFGVPLGAAAALDQPTLEVCFGGAILRAACTMVSLTSCSICHVEYGCRYVYELCVAAT